VQQIDYGQCRKNLQNAETSQLSREEQWEGQEITVNHVSLEKEELQEVLLYTDHWKGKKEEVLPLAPVGGRTYREMEQREWHEPLGEGEEEAGEAPR